MKSLRVALAGESVRLSPGRALVWRDTLFVADTHFGKDATFRAHGRWIPHGTLDDTLNRLDHLLTRHRSRRLVVLGDLFHSAAGGETVPTLTAWRDRHARREILAVPGNHDRHALPLATAAGFELLPPGHPIGPWTLWHEPPPPGAGHALCGHLHPVALLRGPARQSLRLPCFHLRTNHSVLPAFGAFTGGQVVRVSRGDRVMGVGADKVFPLFA